MEVISISAIDMYNVGSIKSALQVYVCGCSQHFDTPRSGLLNSYRAGLVPRFKLNLPTMMLGDNSKRLAYRGHNT